MRRIELFSRLQHDMDIFDAYELAYGIPIDIRVLKTTDEVFDFIEKYDDELVIDTHKTMYDSFGNVIAIFRPAFDDEIISIVEPRNLFWCIRYKIHDNINKIKSWIKKR